MKVINKTRYPTTLIRTILCAVHDETAKTLGRNKRWDRITVTLVYCRGSRGFSGETYQNGYTARLRVPRRMMEVGAFAALWRHELWHLYGVDHVEMPRVVKDNDAKRAVAWGHDVIRARRGRRAPPFATEPEVKIAAALSRQSRRARRRRQLKLQEKAWEQKLRTAEGYLTKIRRSLRRYER